METDYEETYKRIGEEISKRYNEILDNRGFIYAREFYEILHDVVGCDYNQYDPITDSTGIIKRD